MNVLCVPSPLEGDMEKRDGVCVCVCVYLFFEVTKHEMLRVIL